MSQAHVKLVSGKQNDNDRVCGECSACFTVYPVAALNKRPGVTCEHVCEKGCGIWGTHPQECRTYECLWRSNHLGTDEDRPDKSGVIFGANFDDELGLILYAQEFREGSINKLMDMLNILARKHLVYLAYHGNVNNLVMGPFDRATQLSEFLESKRIAFEVR